MRIIWRKTLHYHRNAPIFPIPYEKRLRIWDRKSKLLESGGSQTVIREAIRRIALGRSIDRVDMSPGGTGGVGTARLIHGYVAKVHDDPSDAEFAEYGGTIDVGEYPDETASTEPIIHKGVLLAGTQDNSGGVLLVPTLLSDVTIVSDAATRAMYVVNFSHADVLQYNAHREVTIGVRETEELDTSSDSSPDYDELWKLQVTRPRRTIRPRGITSTVRNDGGKETSVTQDAENIALKVDRGELNLSTDKAETKVGGQAVTVTGQKITLGAEDATEPMVLGQQLAQLMMEFLTECTKVMTPTLMGTMPAVNARISRPLSPRSGTSSRKPPSRNERRERPRHRLPLRRGASATASIRNFTTGSSTRRTGGTTSIRGAWRKATRHRSGCTIRPTAFAAAIAGP